MRHCCEFCRAPIGIDVSENEVKRNFIKGMKARTNKNDPEAIWQLAIAHRDGLYGVPVNEQKALELTKRAADLGNADAQFALGLSYERGELGLKVDKERARDLWVSAAKGGDVRARCFLGQSEFSNGNIIDGARHFHIAAASGYDLAVELLITLFRDGYISHIDLAKSLRARDKACLDMRSDSRDRVLALLKAQGQNVYVIGKAYVFFI